jgi:hypothetical protein
MARNLILSDPSENTWCVICRIGSVEGEVRHAVSFYKTEGEAKTAAQSLKNKLDIPVNIQIFKYSYASDGMGVLKLLVLDGVDFIVEYLAG